MYYWRVKLYDGDDLLVSPEVAEQFKRHIKEKKEHVDYRGALIAVKNISMIEETSDPLPSQTKKLKSGLATGPILNEKGEVRWHWAKKRVNNREWNSYYAQHPSYRLLRRTESGAEIAFKLPSHLTVGEDVQPVGSEELSLLG
jgi:hypothetical protein